MQGLGKQQGAAFLQSVIFYDLIRFCSRLSLSESDVYYLCSNPCVFTGDQHGAIKHAYVCVCAVCKMPSHDAFHQIIPYKTQNLYSWALYEVDYL